MTVVSQRKRQYDTTQIPVESVLLYRSEDNVDFELCHVLSISPCVLEILLKQPLPNSSVVNIAVRDEASHQQFYLVSGKVDGCEQEKPKGVHRVTVLPDRSWSSKFLYDVLCSTPDYAPTSAEKYRVTQDADLENRVWPPVEATL